MQSSTQNIDEILPVVGLARTVLFPGMRCTLLLANLKSFGAVREARRSTGKPLLAICCSDEQPGKPSAAPLFSTGVLAEVLHLQPHNTGLWLTELWTQGRVTVGQFLREDPFRLARVEGLSDDLDRPEDLENLVLEAQLRLIELKRRHPGCEIATTALSGLAKADSIETRVASLMACSAVLSLREQQSLLETRRPTQRLEKILAALDHRMNYHFSAAKPFAKT
ncbi:MAG: LON peptidase substrate-binding domain-containing protein [Deltaproteobacteria bacterium]|nr:LON peptidase substrate-binding domain-containing protein [Deltaproteobacteria bacterium]